MPGAVSGGPRSFDSGYSFSPGGMLGANAGEAELGSSGARTRGGDTDPRTWSVRKLKGVLRHARVPHDDCLEREDLVRRCLESTADLARHSHEYDTRLAAGTQDDGATRVPRSSPLSAGAGPREWSPTTFAAASVLSNDWLGGVSASRDAMQASAGGVAARGVAVDILGSPFGGRRVDSLAGRLPGACACHSRCTFRASCVLCASATALCSCKRSSCIQTWEIRRMRMACVSSSQTEFPEAAG